MKPTQITPADVALIEANIRSKDYLSRTEKDVAQNVRIAVSEAEHALQWDGQRITALYIQGFSHLSGGEPSTLQWARVDPERFFGGESIEENFEITRKGIASRNKEDEDDEGLIDDADDEGILDEDDLESRAMYCAERKKLREILQRWANVTPFVAYACYKYVLSAANDVLRDEVVNIIDGYDDGKSVAQVTREAYAQWMKNWLEKGKVL